MQQIYRIFLASSYELKADREQFEIFIARQNNLLKDKNVYLQVVLWEDIGGEVYPGDKQEHYNKELKTCNIFVMLYWSKVGKYTNIEFDRALGQFRFTEHNPKMYVFEKTAPLPKTQPDADKESLAAFRKKYADKGQFPIQYKDADELTGLFKANLDKLFADKYLLEGSNKHDKPAECLYTDGNSVPIGFIGRKDELRAIKEKLDKGGSLMLINAEGGIGKTSLAAKYWEESLYDYKYNAWLFCEAGIISALKKLAPKLKVDLNGLNEEQQTEAMKQALMPIANDTLFVLDNANKAEDINDFIKIFRGFGWHVLLTSRCHGVLEKAQELHIEHLPPQQAKELFESNYKEDTPAFDQLLDKLLEAIDYHTLLTEIFSKNLAELKGTDETLAKFLNDLETKGLYLENRSFEIKTDYTLNVHKTADDTDAIIEILYDFKALEEQERYYLVNIALLPAVNYELHFLAQLFEPEPLIDLKRILSSLFQKGWLGYSEGSYRISPVIQKLILEKNEVRLKKDSEKLIDNLLNKLDTDGVYLVNSNYDEAAPFAQLVSTITDHFKGLYFWSLGALNDNIYIYYIATGDLATAERSAKKYAEICKTLDNVDGLGFAYTRLGDIQQKLGDIDGASNYYQKSLDLRERLYKSDPENEEIKNGLAISYQKLGGAFNRLKDFGKALEFFHKFNKVMEELNESYPYQENYENGLAISYHRLGNMFYQSNDLVKALEFFQKYHGLKAQLNKRYPDNVNFKNGLAISYSCLGNVYESLENFDKALEFYKNNNELKKQLFEKHPNNIIIKSGLANSFEELGQINLLKIETQSAKANFLEALQLYEELTVTSPQMVEFRNKFDSLKKKIEELNQRTN